MKKRKLNISALFFIFSFVVLVIAFLGMNFYCINQSKILHTYYFSNDNSNQDDIYVTVSVSKYWDDSATKKDKYIGAQYDGVLTNNSGRVFKDWVVMLDFSEDLIIDSSWNGNFSNSGDQVTFIAQGDPAFVPKKCSTTFGAVIYSNNILSLEDYTLGGYSDLYIQDLQLFGVLVLLSFCWIIVLIIYIVLYYKDILHNRRLELDSKIILQSMNTLVNFIDAKDGYTKNHSTRVAIYSSEIARQLKMNKDEVKNLYYIALMHDCGKIGISDNLLNCTRKLNQDEYREIQSHVEIGQKMLEEFTAIPNIRNGAYYHHERYDGTGYPKGLKGQEIPICARIICVADFYDATSSNRCYRSALSKEEILTELANNSGKQFDPEIAQKMISLIESDFVEKVKKEFPLKEL